MFKRVKAFIAITTILCSAVGCEEPGAESAAKYSQKPDDSYQPRLERVSEYMSCGHGTYLFVVRDTHSGREFLVDLNHGGIAPIEPVAATQPAAKPTTKPAISPADLP